MDPSKSSRPRASDFEVMYRQHFALVWAALFRLGVEHPDLEDAVQDVFLVAHRRAGAYTRDSSMRAWLLGISRRVAAEHRRRRRRHRRRIDRAMRAGSRVVEPDDTLRHVEGAELLQRFLASLDDDKREIFVLVELEELTGREAASALGLNRNTAVSRLRAARQAFDRYACRVQGSPRPRPRLGAAHRASTPPVPPHTERRVLGLLMLRPAPPVAPAALSGGLLGGTTVKAAGLALALAGASLGAIKLGASGWSRAPRATSVVAAPARAAQASGTAPAVAPSHIPSVAAAEVPTVASSVPPSVASTADPIESLSLSSSSSPPPSAATPSTATPSPIASPADRAPRRPAPAPDPLRAQNEALQRSRDALRDGDPERALSIVGAVTREHPEGALARELALVRIEALCARGQGAQARGEAHVLRRAYAGSPVVARASCPKAREG